MARHIIAEVNRVCGSNSIQVFKSCTVPGALKKLSEFYAGIYASDLDRDRSQIGPTIYVLKTYDYYGDLTGNWEFSNYDFVDYLGFFEVLKARIETHNIIYEDPF